MSNAAFNRSSARPETIGRMDPSAERLYRAAQELKGKAGPSAVAALLNESPQVVKNWEARGVSAQGAVKAQSSIGCSATWVIDGEGSMLDGTYWPFSHELRAAITSLPPESITRLENVIRATLGLSLLSEKSAVVTDESRTQPSGYGTKAPRTRLPASVEDRLLVGREDAVAGSGQVPPKRSGRGAKGAA